MSFGNTCIMCLVEIPDLVCYGAQPFIPILWGMRPRLDVAVQGQLAHNESLALVLRKPAVDP